MPFPTRYSTSWKCLLVAVSSVLATSALGETDSSANPRDTTCRAVRGSIVPLCNGAICNQGKLNGDLSGRFTSKITSIYPAGSGWVFTAWTRIELDGEKGRIETIDQGTAPFDAKGGPDLAKATELLSIDEARGAYQDRGTLVISGAHQVGQPAPYTGQVCTPLRP
jgi:hypothetical protein